MGPFASFIRSLIPSRKSYFGNVQRGHNLTEKINWGQTDFLNANQIALYVNKAIAKRAEKVGEIEFTLRDASGKDREKNPGLYLLYKPNSYMTGAEFWSLYQTYKDLTGEVYIWQEKSEKFSEREYPKALHLLRPDLCNPIIKDGGIVEFEYRKDNGVTVKLSPEEVFYSYFPDPLNPFRGISILKAAASAIETEVLINQYQRRVLKNSGKVDAVFKFKDAKLTREQLLELEDSYEAKMRKARRTGMPLFLGGDSEYERMGLTPEELGYATAKKMTLEDICIATGVPKSILASMDDAKYDNADAATTIFLSQTIRPLLRNLTQKLDEFMFPGTDTLSFVDPTPANIEQNLKLVDSGVKNHYITRNEARRIAGLEDIPGGDVILVPFNLIPAESVDEVMANPRHEGEKKKELADHPLRDPMIRKRYGAIKTLRMDRFEATFRTAVRAMWKKQLDRLISHIDTTKDFDGAIAKGLLDEAFDKYFEISFTKLAMLPLLRTMLEAGGNDAANLVDDDIQYRPDIRMNEWLDTRSSVLGTELTETTYKHLKRAFTESEGEGESREALIRRIRGVYEGWSVSRATTIARTEVHGAYQQGTISGYRQAGMPIKIWVAVADSVCRDAHLMADGQEQPIEDAFEVGGESLMYPGDPSGSAGNTINCRCTI
jgi:HK97 family phage portal protein